jgi:hypothetical protein
MGIEVRNCPFLRHLDRSALNLELATPPAGQQWADAPPEWGLTLQDRHLSSHP